MYYHVPGACVTNKTGFGFDDRIYWTSIQLVPTFHKSLSDTLSSSSDWTLQENYSDFQLYCQLLLACRYIASGRTTAQKTHPFPSNGRPSTAEHVTSGMCLPSRCLGMGICVSVAAATCSRWLLACGFFYPEDGGDTFLRNVDSHKIYTAPHPRRRHSS
jgi:hypothetical protein